jgi:3-oxoacyl-[acyl-carrier protein] reductase
LNSIENPVALITGASRGIGASVSTLLAEQGCDVVINFHSKRSRAQEVAAAVIKIGRRAVLAQADLTSVTEVAAMAQTTRLEFGRIDLLILNASGGLEKGKPADYAMRLNLGAQLNIVDQSLPLMSRGGRIVFVTSHMAHFFAEKPVDGPYQPVAASKYAGEQALRGRSAELEAKGISLVVVSGDMIEGTITPRLLQRMERGLIESRRDQVGSLPTVEEFAQAIVTAAMDPQQSEKTVFVGNID